MATSHDGIPVKVFVRCRPFNTRENSEHAVPCITFYKEMNQLAISGKMFAYDSVMDPSTSQTMAFNITTKSLVEKVMSGFNCTILAYGQTGSGKTYTMGTEETTESMTSESRGIIPRLVEQLFEAIKTSECPSAYQVYVSMLEIYDEKVNDLLSSAKDLQIREKEGLVNVQGLTRNIVNDLQATMHQLEIGCQLRSKGETAMNAQSSRSHAIFTISVDKASANENDTAFKAKLHLVDLAGSERLKKTQAEGERKKEGIRINEGLLALGNVISALSEASGSKHIPYRDSKITRLLQDSLGGNSYTVMIACVSPADTNAEETLSTLRYADRAKKIKNKPVVNQDFGQAAMLKQLQDKIKQLEKLLADRGDCNPIDYDGNTKVLLEAMEKERNAQNQKQAVLRNTNYQLEQKINRIIEQFKNGKEKIQEIINGTPSEMKDAFKPIELLIKDQDFDADLSIETDMAENEENIENIELNAKYVARQSQLENEIATVVNEIRSKDNLLEMTKNDLEAIKKYEIEKNKLYEKVETLQSERDKLIKELKKNITTGKLAEERRQRVKELEAQINNFKKQLNDYKKLEKQKQEFEQRMKKMHDEILQLKQVRVKLQKTVKEENEKFRAQRLQAERQLTQLKAQERKKEVAHGREMLAQQRKLDVMRQKLEESQRALRKFSLTQAKKRVLNDTVENTTAIKKFLKQEMNHHVAFLETEKISKNLVASRTSLNSHLIANTRKIEKLRRKLQNDEENNDDLLSEIEELEKENGTYQEEADRLQEMLVTLREKQGEYDETTAAEERFKNVKSVDQARFILKIAFDLLCEATENYNSTAERYANEKKTNNQIRNECLKKDRTYQKKLDEYLERLETYRKRFSAEHAIFMTKLESVANEFQLFELAQNFQQMRETFDLETAEMEDDIDQHHSYSYNLGKRAPKKPIFYGHVVNSEDNIMGTPHINLKVKRHSKRSTEKRDISPINGPSDKCQISNEIFKKPYLATNEDDLNTTMTIETHADENDHNSTFIKTSPKRHANTIMEGAPPLKIRQNPDVSLGEFP